nr:Gag-Pol polyprotein [Tanacetum cinerariifolium]
MCSSYSSAFRLSYRSSVFWGSHQASKSVLRSGIMPIGLAASGNLFYIIAFSSFQSLVHESCSKSKKQVTPNPPKGGSKATSDGDWIKPSTVRVSCQLLLWGEGPSNSEVGSQYTDTPGIDRDLSLVTGEHSKGKTALAFSTPTGISLGGSSEPLTLSPNHKPLGGWQRNGLGWFSEVPWVVPTFVFIEGESCDGIDMVIKDLDLEPKIDAMMREFLYLSRWKELSKETSSKILPCGDGSCWKIFKPVASLIAKGKLNKSRRVLSLLSPLRSSESTSLRKSLRCWFGSLDRSLWNEHSFCTNQMVSDRKGTTLFPSGSSMVFM